MFFKRIQLANNPFCKTLTWVVLAAFLLSTACTTTRVIKSHPDTVQNELKKGDVVKITTKDGNSFKLRIVEISPEATEGFIEGYKFGKGLDRILFSEIAA